MSSSNDVVQQDTCPEVESAASLAAGSESQKEEEKRDGSERLVPVSEAIRYRRRAQAAEQGANDLKGEVQDARVELEQARQSIIQLERRQKIDELLIDSEVVDLEVARLLTEVAVEMMDEPDVKMTIDDLKRHKPYLFKTRGSDGSFMAARLRESSHHETEQAAGRAAISGDRRDLLRYLRLRRHQ